ncbi:uncharacterized protein LOC6552718 [Drosophila erecta]|uniref:GG13170 n=1 Tax=Drosophila erecta TaxID=7220 RepID=B3NYM4_DROER|nr:uncharacterized protein LOC6552718 [Drosophila erecta]EDV48005.1 uncharacterized protein Dere_GG13170 [Drosophila erecta]
MSPLDIVLLLVSFHQVICSDFSAMSSEFKQCVRGSQKPKISECLGRSALNFIHRLDETDNVKFVDDFVTVKSETAAVRSLSNVLDTDPVDFRGILENAGAVMGQRSMEWHMDGLYPGLMFKIGPTADANSVAEFVLDGAAQGERQFGFEDPSTGRVLAKQYLLPFLLGLKFNLVALVPLIFAGICLLLKKSLFLVKLAIYVSSFLGLGGIVGGLGGLGGFGGASFSGANFGFGGFNGHRPIGPFPGKTTVFGQVQEEFNHQYDVHEASPYRRTDRKLRFEQPRMAETNPKPTTQDRFYDFENQRRPSNKLLAATVQQEGELLLSNFQDPHRMEGWQAVDCLETESERLLDGATRDNSTWQITDYLSIEPQAGFSRPETGRMDIGLPGKLLELVQGRVLRLQLPRQLTISNAIDDFGSELGLDQGRKKKDKDKNMAMMGGMIMMATLAQMFLGKVILIAGSAFIMAKIALVISLLGSLKKGSTGHSGSGGGGGGTEHVVVHSSHESGWHRSMPTHDTYSQLEQVEEPPPDSHMEYYQAYQMEPLKRRLHQAPTYPDHPRPEATKSTPGFI